MSAAGVGKAPAASVQVNVAPSEGSSATAVTQQNSEHPRLRERSTRS